jgi:hypothetical protein
MEEPPERAGNPNANPPPRSSDANPNRRHRPTLDATQIGKKLKGETIRLLRLSMMIIGTVISLLMHLLF